MFFDVSLALFRALYLEKGKDIPNRYVDSAKRWNEYIIDRDCR